MGAFYGNITLKGVTQENAVRALHHRRSIVTPSLGDYTVVFDSVCDEQDTDAIQALTSQLSREFRCPALAIVVHDDDVFAYFLFHNGELADWYNSCPSYFDSSKKETGPAGGNAERLCVEFGSQNRQEVQTILHRRHSKAGYVFETHRHRDLVHALALPECAVGVSLENFNRGEYPEGLSAKQMMTAADPPPVETIQQRDDRQFYNLLGSEDPTRPCKHSGCTRGAIPNSVMCKRHHFEMIKRHDCPFN